MKDLSNCHCPLTELPSSLNWIYPILKTTDTMSSVETIHLCTKQCIMENYSHDLDLFGYVRFDGPVNPMGSC